MINSIAIKTRSQKFLESTWFFPLLLLLVCLVTYAFRVGAMGFYYDDWPVIFLAKFNNPALFWSWFAVDRPFSAWTYLAILPILGTSPVSWQLFTITLRWLTVSGFWWTLCSIWPQRRLEVGWMALLMVVYPGFMQQSISVAYSQHFICYALFTLSLGLMVWGIRKPKWFWIGTILSMVASTVQLLTMEYFAGLELIRPILLWILIRDPKDKVQTALVKTLRNWAPYLVPIGIFLVYRLVFFNRFSTSPSYNAPVFLSTLAKAPFTAVLQLAQTSLRDFITANLFAWVNTISIDSIVLNVRENLFSWLTGFVAAAVVAFYFIRMKPKEDLPTDTQDHFVFQGIVLGLVGFFLGGLPVWMIGNQISVGTFADRYTLAPMFGGIILLVSLVAWFGAGRTRQVIFLAALFGLSMAFQIRTVYSYRLNWDLQRNYYWQMIWRIPALKPGTSLLAPKSPFSLVGEYGVAFADNLIYNSAPNSTELPYWFFNAYNHLHRDIPEFTPGLPVTYSFRIFTFNNSTSQSLVIDNSNESACVHVPGPDERLAPSLTKDVVALLGISNLDQIMDVPGDTARIPGIFGDEPKHTWCYYYEKADLASQFGDWQEVVKFYEQVSIQGYSPHDGMEWIPFIEGYAYTGDWNQAALLTDQANARTADMGPYLCATWKRIESTTQPSQNRDQVITAVNLKFKCTNP
jgi:hypothetical protein